MPHQMIPRREPSPMTRHRASLYACNAPLVLRFEPSHRGPWEALLTYRCGGCGRVVDVYGVSAEPFVEQDDGA